MIINSTQTKPTITLGVDNASKRSWLSRLKLDHFRNYQQADLAIHAGQLVIIGDNGAGKTNLLEAVSLLSPGRGMRRAKSQHLAYSAIAHDGLSPNSGQSDAPDLNWPASLKVANEQSNWAVAATLETLDSSLNIGTGFVQTAKQGNRIMRLEGVTVSQADIGAHLAVSWLTPQMDGIFLDSPVARRRFLDRLVIAFDPAHIGHLRMIQEASKFGHVIVIVNSDNWLMRKKGYIFMPFGERCEIIEGFAATGATTYVDDRDNTVCEALRRIKPDYFANGGDRKAHNTPEMNLCEELGIEMLWSVGGGKVQSSSTLVSDAGMVGELSNDELTRPDRVEIVVSDDVTKKNDY